MLDGTIKPALGNLDHDVDIFPQGVVGRVIASCRRGAARRAGRERASRLPETAAPQSDEEAPGSPSAARRVEIGLIPLKLLLLSSKILSRLPESLFFLFRLPRLLALVRMVSSQRLAVDGKGCNAIG